MSDFLVDLGGNPTARKLIKSLGLPLPLPQPLKRERGAWKARPLMDAKVAVGATTGAELASTIADALCGAGADPHVSEALRPAFRDAGETHGRPAKALEALGETAKLAAVVFDASGIRDVAGLHALYEFFHPLVGRLAPCARVLVIGRAESAASVVDASAEAVAAQAALEGFVRSVAKEIGRNGSTANLITVARGAEDRLAPVIRFVASPLSAFVTAQPIRLHDAAKGQGAAPFTRSLEGKLALVTGAARGIGEATARTLAREGARVICLDRPGDDAAISQLARDLGGVPLLVDLGAADAPTVIAEAVRAASAGGGLDIVVHNAGITRDKTLARMKPEHWDSVLDVNLAAVVRVTAALEPMLREGGRVICLSSIAGLAGNVGQSAYAASKAGIVGWVRATSARLAPRGITVNAIAPGFIETRLTAAIPMAIREVARRLAALGQGGQPEDVAQAITFLATPGAQGLTGSTLRVCGGSFVGA
jgi:3-oxoacyl-[acyl-carrier protein] reductase